MSSTSSQTSSVSEKNQGGELNSSSSSVDGEHVEHQQAPLNTDAHPTVDEEGAGEEVDKEEEYRDDDGEKNGRKREKKREAKQKPSSGPVGGHTKKKTKKKKTKKKKTKKKKQNRPIADEGMVPTGSEEEQDEPDIHAKDASNKAKEKGNKRRGGAFSLPSLPSLSRSLGLARTTKSMDALGGAHGEEEEHEDTGVGGKKKKGKGNAKTKSRVGVGAKDVSSTRTRRLVVLGDSLSQGFMSGGIWDRGYSNCYGAVIARAMGLDPSTEFVQPGTEEYPRPLPLSLEEVLRKYGSKVKLRDIGSYFDDIEEYYERGAGHPKHDLSRGCWDNLSCYGATIADAYSLRAEECLDGIRRAQDREIFSDGFFALPCGSFYRNALRVLRPQEDAAIPDTSMLGWLEHYCRTGGVENIIVWLGSNNALGSVLRLPFDPSRNEKRMEELGSFPGVPHHDLSPRARDSHTDEERRYTLWSTDLFKEEFNTLAMRLEAAMALSRETLAGDDGDAKPVRAFFATIPPVTAIPYIVGTGEMSKAPADMGFYYDSYTYFFTRDIKFAQKLTREQALYIDLQIKGFNEHIRAVCDRVEGFHFVDIASVFNEMHFQRNNGAPPYEFPKAFHSALSEGQKLPTTDYYKAQHDGSRRTRRKKYKQSCPGGVVVEGGLFSLDGVHPSILGHGLIAHEFMKVMVAEGVEFANEMDIAEWERIMQADLLWSEPIPAVQELVSRNKLARKMVVAGGRLGLGPLS